MFVELNNEEKVSEDNDLTKDQKEEKDGLDINPIRTFFTMLIDCALWRIKLILISTFYTSQL